MRSSGVVVLTAITLAVVPSGLGADSIARGTAVNGVRLGAAFGSDPAKPTLRVLFQNVGPSVQDVLIGAESGRGPMYDMKFIATALDGKEREGLHISAFSAVGGFVGPLSVRLNAGESHELQFSLKDILYTSPTTIRLDALVRQGYSVRVRFEVKQASADWAKLSYPWVGTVSSAEVSQRTGSERRSTALGQQPPVETPNPATAVSEIIVERQGCFGTCPVYTLTLRRQGSSTYIGKTGPRIGHYTAKQVYGGDFDQLSKAISDVHFFDLPDETGPVVIDAEQVTVTVTTPTQSKTVKTFDVAKAPFAFWAVVALADGVAANLWWENPNQPKVPTITGAVPIRKVEPVYTEQARKAKLQGIVWVQVEVQPDGKVSTEHIFVVHGLGMGLDEKAIEAVKQWTFSPPKKDGNPISMATTVQVEFRL